MAPRLPTTFVLPSSPLVSGSRPRSFQSKFISPRHSLQQQARSSSNNYKRAGIIRNSASSSYTDASNESKQDQQEQLEENNEQDNIIENRVKFPSLESESFRHPIDIRATRLLKSIFGIENIIRGLLNNVEQTFFFENLATGIKVNEKQYSSIYKQLIESCKILDIKKIPDLYIKQNSVPNAYTLAIQGNKPFIVLHSSLVNLLSKNELQAVIAHELGHLKSEHGIFLTFANLISLFLPSFVNNTFNLQFLIWLRSAELTCDRAMLMVVQDSNIAISTLIKLTGGVNKYSSELNIDEFLNQADTFINASNNNWLGKRLADAMVSSTTHPLPIFRVRELKKWSQSNHYRSLIQSGSPLSQE